MSAIIGDVAVQVSFQFLTLQGLFGNQSFCQAVELVPVGSEDFLGPFVSLVDDPADFGVNFLGDFLAVLPLLAYLLAQKDQLLLLAEGHRAELFAHPVAGDHSTGQLGGLLQVVGCSGGNVVEHDFLGSTPAQQACQVIQELGLALKVTVFFRQGHRVAQGHPPGDDGDLVDGVAMGEVVHHQGVPGLVVGDDAFLLVADDTAAALRPGDDPFDGLLEFGHPDFLLIAAGGQDGRFVHQVLDVGPHEAGGLTGDDVQVHVLGQGLTPHMHLQDGPAALHIGPVEHDAAVEPPRPQEGGVQDIGAVGVMQQDGRLPTEEGFIFTTAQVVNVAVVGELADAFDRSPMSPAFDGVPFGQERVVAFAYAESIGTGGSQGFALADPAAFLSGETAHIAIYAVHPAKPVEFQDELLVDRGYLDLATPVEVSIAQEVATQKLDEVFLWSFEEERRNVLSPCLFATVSGEEIRQRFGVVNDVDGFPCAIADYIRFHAEDVAH